MTGDRDRGSALLATAAKLVRRVNRVLRPLDVAVVRASKVGLTWEVGKEDLPPVAPLPPETLEALRPTNPRLVELCRRYEALGDHPARRASLWTAEFTSAIDLTQFRASNAYLWQGSRTAAERLQWLLTAYYVKSIDTLGLLDRLDEDGLFGAYCFHFRDGYVGSKDVLDSVNEINALERSLRLSTLPGLTVLDIGAGYGRLAHRLASAFPGTITGYCVDAVPESTFLSEFYLDFRGVSDRISVVPLDEIERRLGGVQVDLVTNVHSFSECSIEAIEWWLDVALQVQAEHLFIVPNAYHNGGTELLSREPDGRFLDFRPAIERRGFRLARAEPKYLDPSLHPFGINTYQYLFSRSAV